MWTDGKYVNWSYEDPDGLMCLDGISVIVKGGNAANVYTYTSGISGDTGLTAPANASGKPAGLSNLSFCYNLKLCPDFVIDIKTYYLDGYEYKYCISSGKQVFFNTPWCGSWWLGVNDYPSVSPISMHAPVREDIIVGNATIDENGDVKVTLNNKNLTLVYTVLYIGTEEDLTEKNLGTNGCPDYWNEDFWRLDNTPETDLEGYSFMFFDL